MITGVTIGEIRRPITKGRAGIAGLARPNAARVPSAVASTVADTPIIKLFSSARNQASSPATDAY